MRFLSGVIGEGPKMQINDDACRCRFVLDPARTTKPVECWE